MINRLVAVTYHFILELIVGILFLFLFYISKKELPPVFLVAALCIGSIVLFTILLAKFRDKGKVLYFVTVLPLLLAVCHQAGLPLFLVRP